MSFEQRLADMDYRLGYDQGRADALRDDVETHDPEHVGLSYVDGYNDGVRTVKDTRVTYRTDYCNPDICREERCIESRSAHTTE